MNRSTWLPMLALLLGTLRLTGQQQQFIFTDRPADYGISPTRLALLDDFLAKWVNEGKIPNAATFIAKRGRIIHYKAFGFRDMQTKMPLERDDIFRIASQTKAITTTAILMLNEEGKLLLDDPLSKYIPYFANPSVLVSYDSVSSTLETRPATRPITIRHLLTHTAGIPYEHPLEHLSEYQVPYFNALDSITLSMVIPKIASRPLLHDPGEQFTYGLATDILGYVVEIVAGQSLASFFKQKIFEPLGMDDTHFYLSREKAIRLVELYSLPSEDSTLQVSNNFSNRYFPIQGARRYYSGGAGLVSTIENYARFCQMLLNKGEFNGKQILSPASVELMFRNQIGDLKIAGRNDPFSFGLEIFSDQSHYGGLASPGAATWEGMYCSGFTIDPEENLIALVFTNIHPFVYYGEFLQKFRNLVYQSLTK
jgi:CubicO group peptidase (beta-lactamase class C family)